MFHLRPTDLRSRSEGRVGILARSEPLHQLDLEESHGGRSEQYDQHGAVNLDVTSHLLLSLYLGLLLRCLQRLVEREVRERSLTLLFFLLSAAVSSWEPRGISSIQTESVSDLNSTQILPE